MSVATLAAVETSASGPARATRTLRVGVLGLGQVGQAVVRGIQSSSSVLGERRLSLRVDAAFVRNPQRPRRCPRVPRVTSNPEAFLRGRYDIVIEVLGGVEPARTLVARLLGRGVSVVSANKALVAAHGESLQRIAARRGASFLYEATALAGVPFIGTLTRRPLVSSLTRLTGIVNGTSNYILTLLARGEAAGLPEAIERAQALGYAEPDASLDISGRDAADKLLLLLRECGGVRVLRAAIPVEGIDGVTAADFAAARERGGVIKPVVHADIGERVSAWVGPAFVPREHPLASVDGALNGICLESRFVPGLFFSGPGAGPDITAATLIDDVVEIASEELRSAEALRRTYSRHARPEAVTRPAAPAESRWFVHAHGQWTLTGSSTRAALEAAFGRGVRALRVVP